MASSTDTIRIRTYDVTQEVDPPRPRPRSQRRLAVVMTGALAACIAVGAIAVGARTGDDAASLRPADRATLARQQEQYVEWLESRAASVSGGGAATGRFVPVCRHMPLR